MNNFFFITPIVTISVAIIGWYIVNKQANYRERRKEIFDLHKKILEIIVDIDNLLTECQNNIHDKSALEVSRIQIFTLQKYLENLIDLYLDYFDISKTESCKKKQTLFADKIESALRTDIDDSSLEKHKIIREYRQSFFYLQAEIQKQIFSYEIILKPDKLGRFFKRIQIFLKKTIDYIWDSITEK